MCITNRLFAMYHAKIDDSDKDSIMSSLGDTNGKCRVVFCTVAFGMGVNISNIRYIIHYGPPLILTTTIKNVEEVVVMESKVMLYFTSMVDVRLAM